MHSIWSGLCPIPSSICGRRNYSGSSGTEVTTKGWSSKAIKVSLRKSSTTNGKVVISCLGIIGLLLVCFGTGYIRGNKCQWETRFVLYRVWTRSLHLVKEGIVSLVVFVLFSCLCVPTIKKLCHLRELWCVHPALSNLEDNSGFLSPRTLTQTKPFEPQITKKKSCDPRNIRHSC